MFESIKKLKNLSPVFIPSQITVEKDVPLGRVRRGWSVWPFNTGDGSWHPQIIVAMALNMRIMIASHLMRTHIAQVTRDCPCIGDFNVLT